MSSDEVLLLALSTLAMLVAWGRWYVAIALVVGPAGTRPARRILQVAPLIALVGLFIVLRAWAAVDVREDAGYLLLYLMFGLAWVGAGRCCFGLLGASWRSDALERGNRAAAIASGGGLIGLMACYAGANIGDGPGWWCVGFAGGLATLAWAFAWLLLDRLGGIGDTVSVEREEPAGWRLAGFLVAAGIICGRGAAGDWHSAGRTVSEFAAAWPLVPLLASAVLVERRLARPAASPVLGPAFPVVAYLAWALFALFLVGAPVMGVRGAGP